jgi:hypothetical protein
MPQLTHQKKKKKWTKPEMRVLEPTEALLAQFDRIGCVESRPIRTGTP